MQGVIESRSAACRGSRRASTVPLRQDWDWGQRQAQRILHRLRDTLRPLIAAAEKDKDRLKLLEARIEIDRQLRTLGDVREAVTTAEGGKRPLPYRP